MKCNSGSSDGTAAERANDGTQSSLGIVLAVAVRLYREGLASSLERHPGLKVKAAVGTLAEAADALQTSNPAVLVVDVSLDGVSEFIRAIRAGDRPTRIVALAVHDDLAAILDFAQAGADGFVSANASIAELAEAITRAAAGELLCSPRLAAQLLQRAARSAPSTPQPVAASLTLREQQVLALLRRGLSNKEIGAALHIAEATVKNHVHHVLEKLQVTTRSKAAMSHGAATRSFDPDRMTRGHLFP